ncbi:MAG: hypothetical protein U5K38_05635 [Woeseiaceae bacterium]|nr:hypothetical protein [Woeseiaceae bacterium]
MPRSRHAFARSDKRHRGRPRMPAAGTTRSARGATVEDLRSGLRTAGRGRRRCRYRGARGRTRCSGDLSIEVRDAGAGNLVAAATVSGGDWLSAALDGAGDTLVVAVRNMAGDNTATVLDPATGTIVGSFALGANGDAVLGTALLGDTLSRGHCR